MNIGLPIQSDYLLFASSAAVGIGGGAYALYRWKKISFLRPTILIFMIFILGIGYFWVNQQEKNVRSRQKQRLLGFAPTYALEMEQFQHHLLNEKTKPNDSLYLNLINREKLWMKVNPTVTDIYTFKKRSDGKVVLIVDSETDYDRDGNYSGEREQRTQIGELYEAVKPEIESAFAGVPAFTDEIYSDRWGVWVSAFVPLHSPSGRVDAVLGVDYPAADLLLEIERTKRIYTAYVAIVLMLVVGFSISHSTISKELFERKRAEAELEGVRKNQIQFAKLSALGEMAGGVAHEINNPLAIIVGRISLMRAEMAKIQSRDAWGDAKMYDEFATSIQKIESTAFRIKTIVRGLETFSRNAEQDPKVPLSIVKVFGDTLALCAERFKARNIEIRTLFPVGFNSQLLGSETQLSQVLLNLLNNAHDAIQDFEEKWVEVRVTESEEKLRISVTDSGFGISEAVQAKLMQPFFTTKEVGKGTGLGLSISKGIIEDHRGRLFYDGTSGRTTFVIELPVLKNQAQAA